MEPVLHVRAFQDNYIWVIRGKSRTHALLVDPGDAHPVLETLPRLGLLPEAVLCTHHHNDHVGGVPELLQEYPGLPVYGPALEDIGGLTHPLQEGDVIRFDSLGLSFQVFDIPGHTRGHIAYYGHDWLFCGDTLFSAGCGRLFEGTAEQMHISLNRLSALPDETQVYCAHEYTLANLRFALTVEPDNQAARAYRDSAMARQAMGQPTIPSNIKLERQINPFLRSATASVRHAAENQSGMVLQDALAVFTAVRRWKDSFR